MIRFDIFGSVRASGTLCTGDSFYETIRNPRLVPLLNSIALAETHDERQTLKKSLPGITWQAHFPSGRRLNAEAEPSGLYMIDLDELESEETVRKTWEGLASRTDELGILAAHVTPSRKGLRVVCQCRPDLRSIEENQAWFAEQTHLTPDPACKDLARFSYLVCFEYFLYLDGRLFDSDFSIQHDIQSGKSEQRPSDAAEGGESGEEMQEGGSYKGIPLREIAEKWLSLNGGMPEEGERNTVLFQLATRMRYICEFKYEQVFQAIPHCGLPKEEVYQLCKSACQTSRQCKMPYDLKMVVNALLEEGNPEEEPEEPEELSYSPHDEEFLERLPRLPIGLRDSLEGKPDKVKMPILAGLMPLAMAYATNVRVRYIDGKVHRLNGMCIIVGNQASGKSAVADVIKVWKRPMAARDKWKREKEDEYRALLRKRRQNDEVPDAPSGDILNVPITISCSTLLKRFKRSKGQHLFSFGEELDTLRKTNGAGSWSSKYDIYRLSFDNGEWGQDYNSDNAESGVAHVAYNWTILGTRGAVDKCFRSDSVENGMSGRVLFARLPESKYEHIPVYDEDSGKLETCSLDEMADDQLTPPMKRMVESASKLSSLRGFLDTPKLREAMQEWVNAKAEEARQQKNSAMDTFRKRACVIGFRCAVVFLLLENIERGKRSLDEFRESKNALQFATTMADYCLKFQLELFGDQFQEVHSRQTALDKQAAYKYKGLFDSLPKVFTIDTLHERIPTNLRASLRSLASRWKSKGLVRQLKEGVFEKNV